MNRRSHFWQRYLYVAGLLLGLAGCGPLRPSPSPSPVPSPPPPPPLAALLHARTGVDEPPPPPSAPEPGPLLIETLPISEAPLSPQERRLYFAPDTGLPVYEVKSFPNPERNKPENSYYLVLPDETRSALVPENPQASEEEVLSAFRNAENEWVLLTLRAINGLFPNPYANQIKEGALLIPTVDKDGKRILMVMQPDEGCSAFTGCLIPRNDFHTNQVQIFWFENEDLRRTVVGFPQIYDWWPPGEKESVFNSIRYNPKDAKIYQLTGDRRFFQFSLFQDEEGKWRWKILPEATSYLEDKQQEVVVEMEALGEATGFFGQGEWEEVERNTDEKLGIETIVYRVHEGKDPNNPDDVGYLVVQTKKNGDDFYFLIITKSQQSGPGASPAAITTLQGQKNLVEAYRQLVVYLPPSLLQIVYHYGNAAGIYIEDESYEWHRQQLGYDFPRENPGSRNSCPIVLYRQFPEKSQEDFLTRSKDDLMQTIMIETIEGRSTSYFYKVSQTVEDGRGLRNATQEEYEMFLATVEGRRPIKPVVMPPEEAFRIWFDENSMVNGLIQFLTYLAGTKGDGSYFPQQRIWKILWDALVPTLDYYMNTLDLGLNPPPFAVDTP